ncbi:hypothetical protein SAMN06265222_107224 [Neorhodopirellula lusitana]|uniref:Transposase n=1 Tax=Neorhodopirellula lusitana TaxID=445327 RepID=A0ABY1QAW2_9BACT|nr:hypothetical protein SAMN06265222_107224 [Neorhodopirellula lusitana]
MWAFVGQGAIELAASEAGESGALFKLYRNPAWSCFCLPGSKRPNRGRKTFSLKKIDRWQVRQKFAFKSLEVNYRLLGDAVRDIDA